MFTLVFFHDYNHIIEGCFNVHTSEFCKDVKNIPYKNNSVDSIVFKHVLNNFNQYEEFEYFLEECYRVLKPGHPIYIYDDLYSEHTESLLKKGFYNIYGIDTGVKAIKKFYPTQLNEYEREQTLTNFISLFDSCDDKTMVEVGCFTGESSEFWADTFGRVYLVDPFESGYDENDSSSSSDMKLVRNIFEDKFYYDEYINVEHIDKRSVEASFEFKDESLDLVYLDGSHKEEDVLNDLKHWYPKVKQGGYISGDDISWKTVRNALDQFFKDEEIIQDGNNWYIMKKNVNQIKYSIVIPTFNHLNDCLIPCLDSIERYTDMSQTEIVIVANGCTDGTEDYLTERYTDSHINVQLVTNDEPIGFPCAINEGVKVSKGEFIILLNNDVILLDQNKHRWIEMLEEPIGDSISMCGCKSLPYPSSKIDGKFCLFFCVMMKKSFFEEMGGLDEDFSPGYAEDMMFCLKASLEHNKGFYAFEDGAFPIYHNPDQTVKDLPGWNDTIKKNITLLEKKYLDLIGNENKQTTNYLRVDEDNGIYFKDITAVVCTRNRTTTTLASCLLGIINQHPSPPGNLIIIDDNAEFVDMRNNNLLRNIFLLMDRKNISWKVIPQFGKGPAICHRKSLEVSETNWIWRVDDDDVPSSNCLVELITCSLQYNIEKIGAVGGLILDPNINYHNMPKLASNKIEDIFLGLNRQWYSHIDPSSYEVDHLNNSFLYRKDYGIQSGNYPTNLSRASHREETMFTYQMKCKNFKIILCPRAVTWHLKENSGGIRDIDHTCFSNDDIRFNEFLNNHNVKLNKYKFFVLDNGIGDHYIFKKFFNDYINDFKRNNETLILSCCYPEVFKDIKFDSIISIEEAKTMLGNSIDKYNIYKKGFTDGEEKHLYKIYEEIYL